MESNIKFVREYDCYGSHFTDTIYKSGRCVSREGEPPETVKAFIANAKKHTRQYDKIMKYWEVIHE